jgi:hypothetical protein
LALGDVLLRDGEARLEGDAREKDALQRLA